MNLAAVFVALFCNVNLVAVFVALFCNVNLVAVFVALFSNVNLVAVFVAVFCMSHELRGSLYLYLLREFSGSVCPVILYVT